MPRNSVHSRNPPASTRASNTDGVVKTYALSGSPGRCARVVHDLLRCNLGSRNTSSSTIVPFPTPPGPETTKINGSRAELLEERSPLLGAESLDAAVVSDADLVHHATRLDLADARK